MVASAPAAGGGGVTSAPLVLCAIYMLYMVEWYTQHAVAFAARLDLGVGRSDAQVCCLYSFCTIHFTLELVAGTGPRTSHVSRLPVYDLSRLCSSWARSRVSSVAATP